MSAIPAVIGLESAAWLKEVTTDGSGVITAVGAEHLFNNVADGGPEWAADASAAKSTFISQKVGTGATIEWPQNTNTYDGNTGTIKTSGASGTPDKLVATINTWGKTLAGVIPGLRGKNVIFCLPIGLNAVSSEKGFYYLLGKVSGAIKISAKGDSASTWALEVSGASFTADSGGHTALAYAPSEITPVDGDAITPTALVSGDITALLTGAIVVK